MRATGRAAPHPRDVTNSPVMLNDKIASSTDRTHSRMEPVCFIPWTDSRLKGTQVPASFSVSSDRYPCAYCREPFLVNP